jgi:hypothetical protein
MWRKGEDGPGMILVVTTLGGFEEFMFALQDARLPDGLPALISVSAWYGGAKSEPGLAVRSTSLKKRANRLFVARTMSAAFSAALPAACFTTFATT